MKRTILAALALVCTLSAPAAALTIPYEHFSGYKPAANNYGVPYSYSIGFIDDALRIDVDLMLFGATQGLETLMQRWETGIESIWSTVDRFAVPILFNVDFVSEGWDKAIRITEGYGRWNTGNWFTERPNNDHERVAAHEFGHYISLFDEYKNGALNPATMLYGTGGLMDVLSGPTLASYYEPFLDWYELRVAEYGGDDAAPVPEPSSLLLLGAGLLALAVVGKRIQVV